MTGLKRAQNGLGNAGRGPFQILPGEEKQVFRINGDTEYGMVHTLTVCVYDEVDYADGVVRTPSPLTGILRFSQDGCTPISVEIDIKHGTSFAVPASMIDFVVRNAEGGVLRSVGAFANALPYTKLRNATRTVYIDEVVGDGALAPTLVNIPRFAIACSLYTDPGFTADGRIYQYIDAALTVLSEIIGSVGQASLVPVPNSAVLVRLFNQSGGAINRYYYVFELAF